MIEIVRVVTTAAPVPAAFRYLADFTTTAEWDPGTVRTTRLDGDGGVGTRYANVSRFLGRRTELTYVVEEHIPEVRIALRGANTTVVTRDTMNLASTTSGGTDITYRATFEFSGWSRWVEPLLRPAFRRLGDRAAADLRTALDGLAP